MQEKFGDGEEGKYCEIEEWKEGDVIGVAIDLVEQSILLYHNGDLTKVFESLEGTSVGVFPAVSGRGESTIGILGHAGAIVNPRVVCNV